MAKLSCVVTWKITAVPSECSNLAMEITRPNAANSCLVLLTMNDRKQQETDKIKKKPFSLQAEWSGNTEETGLSGEKQKQKLKCQSSPVFPAGNVCSW